MGVVHVSTDVTKAEAAAGPWLRRDPTANNPALSLLARQAERPHDACFWWVTRGDHLAGLCIQIGSDNPIHIRTDDFTIVPDLVDAIAADVDPHTPATPPSGVDGEVRAAAAFAAAWTTRTHTPAGVSMLSRLYQLDPADLTPPPPDRTPPGSPRLATRADLESTVLPWAIQFQRDAHLVPDDELESIDLRPLEQTLLWKLDHDEIWLWDDDGPMAMAAAPQPVAGVSRIHLVYTSPEHRTLGLGSAVTAAAANHILTAGATHCTLFTDLRNPTSNAIYQQLGFRPIAEYLNVTFGSRRPHP